MIVWDSSALLAAIDPDEPRHLRAWGILEREERHGGSLLLRAEVFGHLVRRGRARPGRLSRFLAHLDARWGRFTLIQVDPTQVEGAERVMRRHALRGADAIHVAAALHLAAGIGRANVRFASGDAEQLAAARREGLHVIAL